MLKFLLVVLLFAVLVYAALRFLQSRGDTGGSPARRTKPLPPDDDPEFLRDLDYERWKQRRAQRKPPPDGATGEGPAASG